MDWINSALAGVVAGGALTYGSTVLTNRSTAQRDDRKAQAEARAKRQEEWAAFQIQAIADLQERLDAISPVLGVDTNERELGGVLRAMSSAGGMPASRTPVKLPCLQVLTRVADARPGYPRSQGSRRPGQPAALGASRT